MSDERRYDEREVGLIFKRVAELHEREGGKTDKRGLTRGEIEEVVTELGISRALVSRAAADVSLQDLRNRPSKRLGGKTDLMFEDVVGPIDESLHTRMLEVLRRHLGEPGKLQREGGALIWSTGESGRRIHFTAVEHAGRTTRRCAPSRVHGAHERRRRRKQAACPRTRQRARRPRRVAD